MPRAIPTKDPFAVGAGRPSRFGIAKVLISQAERFMTRPEANRGAVSAREMNVVKETMVGFFSTVKEGRVAEGVTKN